jgi:hypothetical protein
VSTPTCALLIIDAKNSNIVNVLFLFKKMYFSLYMKCYKTQKNESIGNVTIILTDNT